VAGLVPTALVLPVVKLKDTGFRAPWCSKCRDAGLVGLGVAMRMELCEMRMRIGLRGELDSNASAVLSVEVSAPRSLSRSGLGLRLGGTVIVLGGPSCCQLMLVSAMSFLSGRGVRWGSFCRSFYVCCSRKEAESKSKSESKSESESES
jgi:hypothetical protein